MNCVNCGAALPAHTDQCAYCGTLNDTDLKVLDAKAAWNHPTGHECPRCRVEMKGLCLQIAGREFGMERCPRCLGMFFHNIQGLSELLKESVPHLEEVDYLRLMNFAQKGRRDDWPVAYIPCPLCGTLMLRKLYGKGSGVIIDRCRKHGLWLDGGELGRLVRWARLGGLQREEELAREEESRKKTAQAQARAPNANAIFLQESPFSERGFWGNDQIGNLLYSLFLWIKKACDSR